MYFHPASGRTFPDHSAIRSGLSNVIFPEVIADDMLAFHGVVELARVTPTVSAGQVAEAIAPVRVSGTWTQAWVVRVETPQEAAAKVPQSVTRRQGRQALLLAGLLDSVVPAIDAIPDATERRLAQIEWEDSQTYERQRPLVIQIGAAIGLDAAGLDALFVQAAGL